MGYKIHNIINRGDENMKVFSTFIMASVLIFSSLNVLAADKVIISGKPIVVTPNGSYYAVPADSSYTPRSDYYYVTVNGTDRVCYRETQPNLVGVNLLDLSLRIGSNNVTVHCYDYSPDYFTTQ